MRWSSRLCSQAEMPSGISRMMISAASSSATRPRKAPNRNPTGVRTSDRSRLEPERAGDDVGGAADHDGDEGRGDELLAHEGRDRGGRRQQRAAEAGEAGAEAEGQHVDPVGVRRRGRAPSRHSAWWRAPAGRRWCGCRPTTAPRRRRRSARSGSASSRRTNTGRRATEPPGIWIERHERPEQQQASPATGSG